MGYRSAAGEITIDETFIDGVEGLLKPGTSALFVLDREGDLDAVLQGIRGLGGTVLKTTVDVERAKLIQSTLADDSTRTIELGVEHASASLLKSAKSGNSRQRNFSCERIDNDGEQPPVGDRVRRHGGAPIRFATRSPNSDADEHYLYLLDMVVVVRLSDGTFTVDRKPFPAAINIVGCTTAGFLVGLVLAAPLSGAIVGAAVASIGTAVADQAGIGTGFHPRR